MKKTARVKHFAEKVCINSKKVLTATLALYTLASKRIA
jgi:hypothetical protein